MRSTNLRPYCSSCADTTDSLVVAWGARFAKIVCTAPVTACSMIWYSDTHEGTKAQVSAHTLRGMPNPRGPYPTWARFACGRCIVAELEYRHSYTVDTRHAGNGDNPTHVAATTAIPPRTFVYGKLFVSCCTRT